MDTSKLKKGMVVKNYKVMCELLGEDVKGNSANKNRQLEEWGRYFKWTKDKYSFVIQKVYESPHPLSLEDHVELLLLHILSLYDKTNKPFLTTRLFLLYKLSMVNYNFLAFFSRQEEVSELVNIHISRLKELFNCTEQTLKSTIEHVLDNLVNKGLLHYDVIQIIVLKEEDGTITRPATDTEIKSKLKIQQKVFEEMNIEDLYHIIKRGKIQEYQKRMESHFQEDNIEYMYDAYKFIFLEDYVEKEKEKLLNKFLLSSRKEKSYRKIINTKVKDKISHNANNRQTSALKSLYTKADTDMTFEEFLDIPLVETLQVYMDIINKLPNSLQRKLDSRFVPDLKNFESIFIKRDAQVLQLKCTP